MNFTTKPIAIETIVADDLEFLIPVYQRPYVWDDIEIKKLLEDLKYNFENCMSSNKLGQISLIS